MNVDKRVACSVDADCEIFVSCCAHCSPIGTVTSLNKTYAPIGSLVTRSFYCPMCAEGGCTKNAPRRVAICRQGTCSRRDTEIDAGTSRTRVVANDPANVARAADLEITAAVLHRACLRAAACGTVEARDCAEMTIPFDATHAKDCFDSIDRLPCTGQSPLAIDVVGKLPACKDAVDRWLERT